MPAGITRLTSLRTLKKLVLGGDSQGCTLECLNSLNFLRECQIEGLGNVLDDQVSQAKRSQLHKLKNLWRLVLEFEDLGNIFEYVLEEERKRKDEEVIGALQMPPNVKELVIWFYNGNSFDSWNLIMSLTKLRSLHLKEFKRVWHWPALGKLPSLEELQIWVFKGVRRVGNEFLGIESNDILAQGSSLVIAFPKLISLDIRFMAQLEEWDSTIIRNGEIMPHLSSLRIGHCPKLKVLPDYLLQSTKLQELSIWYCPIVKERYKGKWRGVA